MLWRRWHRWIALPAAMFLLFVSTTGLLLHLEVARTASLAATGNQPPGLPVADLPDGPTVEAMMVRVFNEARREPNFTVASVSLTFTPGVVIGSAADGIGPDARRIEIDASTGERIAERADPMELHFFLQDIHAGYRFGWWGRMVSILCGLSLLVLAISGLQIWYDSYRRRKNRALFWK